MYLLDTNIILELLLNQIHADEIESFLYSVSPDSLYISDFSTYSIGIVLFKKKLHQVFTNFITDLLLDGGVKLKRLSLDDMVTLQNISQQFVLDFDDAYQYTLGEKYNLTIISFDTHFDKTEKSRKTLADILK